MAGNNKSNFASDATNKLHENHENEEKNLREYENFHTKAKQQKEQHKYLLLNFIVKEKNHFVFCSCFTVLDKRKKLQCLAAEFVEKNQVLEVMLYTCIATVVVAKGKNFVSKTSGNKRQKLFYFLT